MSSNPNYKPSEGKREEFRKYLEKTGVMDALTKVLVSLYEEPDKPENAIEYICNKLASQVCGDTLDSLKAQLEEANAKITDLEQENTVLKSTAASGANLVEGEEAPVDGSPATTTEEVPAADAAPAPPPETAE